MKTPKRLIALHSARQSLRLKDQKLTRMKNQLKSITSEKGVAVEAHVQEEMDHVIAERSSEMEALPETDFRRVFWEQQVMDFDTFCSIYFQVIHVGICHESERENWCTLASSFLEVVSQLISCVAKSV